MKLSYVRFVSAFFALAALAVSGHAQVSDQLLVNVPYDFVVSGKTLPAGAYRVSRISDNDLSELAITSFEQRAGALLLSSEVTSTNENKPALRFEHIGDQYFLSRIETANHIFTIAVPNNPAPIVAMKRQPAPSTSSSSGAN